MSAASIATSVPDEREWIQWRGRTARQDRPGQYHIVLNRQDPNGPFADHPNLESQLLSMRNPELSRLLGVLPRVSPPATPTHWSKNAARSRP